MTDESDVSEATGPTGTAGTDGPRAAWADPGPDAAPGPTGGPGSTGHPVRSFVAVVAAIVAVLLTVAWTGLSSPRLRSPGGGTWWSGPTSYRIVDVTNDGALPVRVEGATAPGSEGPAVLMGAGTAAGRPPAPTAFEPFTLAAGETRAFYVAYADPCTPGQQWAQARISPLVLEVRAPAGWRQERTFGDQPHEQQQMVGCP